MKSQSYTGAQVELGTDGDLKDAALFTPSPVLHHPRRNVTITFPETESGALDDIRLVIEEGDWEHSTIAISGEMGGGLLHCAAERLEIAWTVLRCDQIERVIEALQLAVSEADKLGLRRRRQIPKKIRRA